MMPYLKHCTEGNHYVKYGALPHALFSERTREKRTNLRNNEKSKEKEEEKKYTGNRILKGKAENLACPGSLGLDLY